MDYVTACPKCVKEKKHEQMDCLTYVRKGVGSCRFHGEMTVKEVLSIYSDLGLLHDQPQQDLEPVLIEQVLSN